MVMMLPAAMYEFKMNGGDDDYDMIYDVIYIRQNLLGSDATHDI